MRFNSPTINVNIPPRDFIKMCMSLEDYLKVVPKISIDNHDEIFRKLGGGKVTFPVAYIRDVIIFFQHYDSFESACEKWEIRKKRINTNKIIILLVDNNCTINEYKLFEQIQYKNKYFITGNELFIGKPDVCFIDHMTHDKKNWFDVMKGHIAKKYYEQLPLSEMLKIKD